VIPDTSSVVDNATNKNIEKTKKNNIDYEESNLNDEDSDVSISKTIEKNIVSNINSIDDQEEDKEIDISLIQTKPVSKKLKTMPVEFLNMGDEPPPIIKEVLKPKKTKKVCDYIMKRGKRSGEECGKIIRSLINDYCSIHQKQSKKKKIVNETEPPKSSSSSKDIGDTPTIVGVSKEGQTVKDIVKEKVKERLMKEKTEKEELEKKKKHSKKTQQCSYTFKKNTKRFAKGEKCPRKTKHESGLCSTHNSKPIQVPDEDEPKDIVVEEQVKPSQPTITKQHAPNKRVSPTMREHPTHGLPWDENTNIIMEDKSFNVIGKYINDMVVELDDDDRELCRQHGWKIKDINKNDVIRFVRGKIQEKNKKYMEPDDIPPQPRLEDIIEEDEIEEEDIEQNLRELQEKTNKERLERQKNQIQKVTVTTAKELNNVVDEAISPSKKIADELKAIESFKYDAQGKMSAKSVERYLDEIQKEVDANIENENEYLSNHEYISEEDSDNDNDKYC
jgi:hypothetical protein